jgi:putative solute:sodium symporter small subunit
MSNKERLEAYWKANLKLIGILMAIWFLIGYVLPIMLVDVLNQIKLGGAPLGFWIAHQGSMYVFIILIFVYVWQMAKIDKEFDVEED